MLINFGFLLIGFKIRLPLSYLELIQPDSYYEEPRPSPANEDQRHIKVVPKKTSVVTVRVENYDAEPVRV